MKLPLSFKVPNYVFSGLQHDSSSRNIGDIYNNEKMLVNLTKSHPPDETKFHLATWGLNIYDGACWEVSLWLLNDNHATR